LSSFRQRDSLAKSRDIAKAKEVMLRQKELPEVTTTHKKRILLSIEEREDLLTKEILSEKVKTRNSKILIMSPEGV